MRSETSTIIHPPLSFVRSGWIDNTVGRITNVVDNGYIWSHVAKNTNNAYLLTTTPASVDPLGSYGRIVGRPLRHLSSLLEKSKNSSKIVSY